LLLLLLPISGQAEYLGELSEHPYASDSTANPSEPAVPSSLTASTIRLVPKAAHTPDAGIQKFYAAQRTLAGIEVMAIIKKGQMNTAGGNDRGSGHGPVRIAYRDAHGRDSRIDVGGNLAYEESP
ncbi:MAG: hypothetical protein ABIU05_13135, partial [Nitrospirales bacterium]